MDYRTIRQIYDPPPTHWVGNGFRVHHFFPGNTNIGTYGMSPFYLLDYNAKMEFSPSDHPRGVGVHPHRGIETVTIAYHGKIAHHDSAGNSGVIGQGEVQWMTAGGAVLHKEYHEAGFNREGGLFQMVQLWVNLPAKEKMTPAKYQAITLEQMGKFVLESNGGVVEVIAGEYRGEKGPASFFSPLSLFNARLNKGATAGFSFPVTYNSGFLVIEGEVMVNNTVRVDTDRFVLFNHDNESFSITARSDAVLLILAGEPIDEPLFGYGPFLMNTRDEIRQAYEDYHNGKFGFLED